MKQWLLKRFSEKSTKTALIGLFTLTLQHYGIPMDILTQLNIVLVAILVGSAATEG